MRDKRSRPRRARGSRMVSQERIDGQDDGDMTLVLTGRDTLTKGRLVDASMLNRGERLGSALRVDVEGVVRVARRWAGRGALSLNSGQAASVSPGGSIAASLHVLNSTVAVPTTRRTADEYTQPVHRDATRLSRVANTCLNIRAHTSTPKRDCPCQHGKLCAHSCDDELTTRSESISRPRYNTLSPTASLRSCASSITPIRRELLV